MAKRRSGRPRKGEKNIHANDTPRHIGAERISTPRVLAITTIISVTYIVGFLVYSYEVAHDILASAPSSWLALLSLLCVLVFLTKHIGPEARKHVGGILNALSEGAERLATYFKNLALRIASESRELVASRNRNKPHPNEEASSNRRYPRVSQILLLAFATFAIVVAMCVKIAVDQPVDAAPSAETAPKRLPEDRPEWKLSDFTAGWPLPFTATPFETPPMPGPRGTDRIKVTQGHAKRARFPIRHALPLHRKQQDQDDQTVQTYAPSPPLPQICLPPFLIFMSTQELRACGELPLGYPPPPRASDTAIY
jgi:hypothetical protein